MFWKDPRQHDAPTAQNDVPPAQPEVVVEQDEMEGDPIGAQLVALAEQLNNPAPVTAGDEQDGESEHQGFYWQEAAPAVSETTDDEPAAPQPAPDHPRSIWEPVSYPAVEPAVVSDPQPADEPQAVAELHSPMVEAANDIPQPAIEAEPAGEHDRALTAEVEEVHDAEPVVADEPPASVEVAARPVVSEAAAEVASRLDALEAAAAQPILADSPATALADVSTAEQLLAEAAQLAQMDAHLVIKQAEIAAAGLVAKAREEAARITEQARRELADARREAELTVNRARAQSDQILTATQVRADELLDQARDLSEVARVAMQTVQSAADRAAGELSRAHRTITSQLNSDSVQSELRLTEIGERSRS